MLSPLLVGPMELWTSTPSQIPWGCPLQSLRPQRRSRPKETHQLNHQPPYKKEGDLPRLQHKQKRKLQLHKQQRHQPQQLLHKKKTHQPRHKKKSHQWPRHKKEREQKEKEQPPKEEEAPEGATREGDPRAQEGGDTAPAAAGAEDQKPAWEKQWESELVVANIKEITGS